MRTMFATPILHAIDNFNSIHIFDETGQSLLIWSKLGQDTNIFFFLVTTHCKTQNILQLRYIDPSTIVAIIKPSPPQSQTKKEILRLLGKHASNAEIHEALIIEINYQKNHKINYSKFFI